jgi:aminopeptidase N
MFDAVSYNKGGRILHMLRTYVGDSAFFRSLNLYLTTNKFKSAEAHQLRLAFEEVTGKDLNWFFNQWYFGSGNPELNITYNYNEGAKQAQVIVEQTQAGDKLFSMPVKVDVWNGNTPTRYTVWIGNRIDTFNFPASARPSLVNFDAEKALLAKKTENKSLDEYVFQYRHAGNYVDRREAIDFALKNQKEPAASQVLMQAIKDPFWNLRAYVINRIELSNNEVKNSIEPTLFEIAQKDRYKTVKAAAISKLGNYKSAKYASFFKALVNDSSYSVSGSALDALNKIDSAAAVTEAKRLSATPSKGRLYSTIKTINSAGDVTSVTTMLNDFEKMPLGQDKFQKLGEIFEFIEATTNFDLFKKAVDVVFNFEKEIPDAFKDQVVTALHEGFKEIQKEKADNGLKDQADYIASKLPKEKGF